MKTKISHLGRSSVSVILAVMMLLSTMLIGTVSTVNAIGMSNGACIYFDNSKTNWKDNYINFVIGHNSYSSIYKMNQVANTDLYYCQMPNWDGATYVAVCGTSTEWGSGNWSSANLTKATHYTAAYTGDFNFESNKSYLLQTSSSTNNTAVTPSYFDSSNGSLNVEVKVDNSTPSSSIADISVTSYKFGNSKDSVESTSATISSDSVASTNLETAYSATTTLKCNSIKDGYKFVGWYVDNSLLSSNESYTYNPYYSISSNKFGLISVEARFEQDMSSVAQSVSLTASPETVTSGGSTTLTATLKNKAEGVGNVTYTFKSGDTTVGTLENTDKDTASVNVENITSDTTYTVTVSADGYKDVSATATVTVKQLETWYLLGHDFDGKWTVSDKDFPMRYDSVSGNYYCEATKANGKNHYFRFHDASEQYTAGSDGEEVTLNSETHSLKKGGDGAFRYTGSANKYIVWLDSSKKQIWITSNATHYNVTYGVNDEAMGSVKATYADSTSIGESPASVEGGKSVTFTANPSKGFAVEGWYSDAGCTNKIDSAGTNKTYTEKVNADTNVYVKFREAKKYTVNFSSSNETFGTVSATNGATSIISPATVTEGDTVTFTAKPSSGYALSNWTVTVNDTSKTYTDSSLSLNITAGTTVVANFKVEDSGTIVKNKYFLYGSTDDPRKWEGMQAYDKQGYGKYDVYEKDGKYIVTLNKEHYKQLFFAFSTSDYYLNMVPNASLNDVKAENPEGLKLVEAGIQQYNTGSDFKYGTMNIVSENSDNIGDIKIIYDPDAKTYTVKATKNSVSDTTVNIVGKDGTIRDGLIDNKPVKTTAVLGNTTLSIKNPDDEVIDPSDSYNNRAVTAKKVPYGSKVTVKTTINPNATFAGHKGSDYYVKGFSINGFTGGVLTQEAGNAHESYEYEYTFTVKKDVYADVSTIEITPIYFLKNDSDCITFYVENFMDAKAKWGDTIACYAYYNSDHALGDYPGQPMVNAEGSIYMQIPKHIGDDQSNVVKGITLNNYVWDYVHVSGDDGVRKSKNCQTYDYDDFKYLANMSQVNSSDSVANIKNIVYRFKYHTYNNTSAEAGNVPKDKLTETTVDNTKYEVFVDYYDKPTDIFGTIINGDDAVTVDTVKTQREYLTIVSDGYVNYSKDYLGQYATKWYIYNKADEKVAALPPSALLYGLTKSSTELENLVTQGAVPQDFMSDSGASTDLISDYWASFKSLYKDYAGKYAIINYESSIHSSGRDGAEDQPGERCDGRWYYSVDKAKITGDIKIEYADTLDSFTTMTDVKTDTFKVGTATGENTAAEAYFTSPAGQSTTGKPIHVETTSDNSENFMFTVGATSSTTNGYTFVGWYRLIDDTYKAVNDPSELNKTTGQVARNANVVLVARYIKTPGGSMTFHHSLYNGTNAGGGKATTEIQVVVKSSDGIKEYYNSGRIDSTASIDKKTISEILTDQQGAKITVTLYTTTKNLYNFNGYYSAENTTDITAFPPSTADFTKTVSGDRKNGRVTESVYTFSFNEYYNRYAGILTAPDAGTVYYNFYSDITSIKVPYKVQFSYEDREGNQKYYNKAGYVDPENTSSYTFDEIDNDDVKVTLTESFILTLAPYESNFTKNLTWDRNSIRTTAFDSSKSESSIASAVVNSEQSEKKIHLNVFRDKYTNEPTSYNNENGNFVLFTKNDSAELPYGSVFYTSNGDGTYTYDITAPKTYNDKQFMYWAIYSDPDCKNLVINAYNSEGHFSYVAYDNCWIVPVYEESSTPSASVKKVYTTTQFMEVTRNQWTANNADSFTTGFDVDAMTKLDDFNKEYGEDKLYADFVLNFFYNGKQLSTFDPTSSKVQTGVLIQRLELDRNETTGYITDLDHYANKKFTPEQLDDAKKDAIKKITTGNSVIPSVKQQINNSRLDNKNRLQYYTRFNNVKGNNDCVFRLYTYVQYTDADGQPAVELSNPVYFTFYDIANK